MPGTTALIDGDLPFLMEQASRLARMHHHTLPLSRKAIVSPEDLAQEMLTHLVAKVGRYDSTRGTFRAWARQVLMNRLRRVRDQLYNDDRRPSRLYDVGFANCVVTYDEDGDGVVPVLSGTWLDPEALVTAKEFEIMSAKAIEVPVDEVKELCGEFGIDFTTDDVMGSLERVLDHTLNEGDGCISAEDFDALAESKKNRLGTLGEKFTDGAVKIVTKKKGGSRKGGSGGTGRSNENGPVARIRHHFAKGVHTVPDMKAALEKEKVEFSEATVKTQVGKLRKEAGLATGRRGRSPSGSGILFTIREAFNDKGLKTVAEVAKYLDSKKVEYSPATVKTQVGKLRKEAGLSKETKAKAVDKAKPAAAKGGKKAAAKGGKKAAAKGGKKAADKKADTKGATGGSRRRRRSA